MGRYLEVCNRILRDGWARRAVAMLAQVHEDRRDDLRYRFEERAGICEYDGGMGRSDAERVAYEELVRCCTLPGTSQ